MGFSRLLLIETQVGPGSVKSFRFLRRYHDKKNRDGTLGRQDLTEIAVVGTLRKGRERADLEFKSEGRDDIPCPTAPRPTLFLAGQR